MGKTSSEVKDRYNKKAYDEIKLRVKKGRKAEIQEWASAKGKSVNLYIIDLINKDMGISEPTEDKEKSVGQSR